MQSGEGNQSQPSSVPPPMPGTPTVREIQSGMVSGETPLDFINKNMKQPVQVVQIQDVVAKVEQDRAIAEAARVKEAAKPEVKIETKPEVPFEIHPEITKAVEPHTAPDSVEVDNGETVNPKAEDFKRVRTALKETNTVLNQIKAEKESLAAQVKKYETGEAFPEILQEKENKIAELSQYEKLVSLKTSKAYQEAYIKPLSTLRSKFIDYGKEYDVPEEVMNQALNLKSSRELDSFLEDHFTPLAGVELKQVIREMQGIQSRAQQAELEPAKEIEKLQAQHAEIEAQRQAQTRQTISEKAKNAWVKSLTQIQAEGRITPLIHKESDAAFNENFSTPIRTRAAQEFGRLMSELTEGGLHTLSDEAAIALANYVLHANASAVNFEMGKAALDYANQIEEGATRASRLLRPDIGGSGSGVADGAPTARAPSSPQEAVRDLLTKHVLATR